MASPPRPDRPRSALGVVASTVGREPAVESAAALPATGAGAGAAASSGGVGVAGELGGNAAHPAPAELVAPGGDGVELVPFDARPRAETRDAMVAGDGLDHSTRALVTTLGTELGRALLAALAREQGASTSSAPPPAPGDTNATPVPTSRSRSSIRVVGRGVSVTTKVVGLVFAGSVLAAQWVAAHYYPQLEGPLKALGEVLLRMLLDMLRG